MVPSSVDTLRARASTPLATAATGSQSARMLAHRASLIALSGSNRKRARRAENARKIACGVRPGPEPARDRASMKASTSSFVRHAASRDWPACVEGRRRSPIIRKVPALTASSLSARTDQLACSIAESSSSRCRTALVFSWGSSLSSDAAAPDAQVRIGRAWRASSGRSRIARSVSSDTPVVCSPRKSQICS